MTTYIFLILRILVNPLSNVFQKRLTDYSGQDAVVVNFVSYLLLAVSSVAIFLPGIDVGGLSREFWLWSLAMGAFGAIGNSMLVLALKGGDLSVLGPINSYKSVVGLIFGILILGELPTLLGLAGMALIVMGSYFVFDGTDEGFSWSLLRNKAILFRLGAMVFAAIEAVFIKKVILYSDTTSGFVAWCVFGALFSLLLIAAMKAPLAGSMRALKWRDCVQYIVLILCIGTTQLSTSYVFDNMNVGYALALFQLSTLISIALGYFLFQEKNILKKTIGSVIMIVGSVLIIFG